MIKGLKSSQTGVKHARETQDDQNSIGSEKGRGVGVDQRRSPRMSAKRGAGTRTGHREFERVPDRPGFPHTTHNGKELPAHAQTSRAGTQNAKGMLGFHAQLMASYWFCHGAPSASPRVAKI